MFNFFQKKKTKNSSQVTLKLTGLHCTSCAMNIDGALEDTDGIIAASTSYAKSEVVIHYLPEKVDLAEIIKIINQQGYQVS